MSNKLSKVSIARQIKGIEGATSRLKKGKPLSREDVESVCTALVNLEQLKGMSQAE